jgi:hypothetical protein
MKDEQARVDDDAIREPAVETRGKTTQKEEGRPCGSAT